jgi:hypothetical protein
MLRKGFTMNKRASDMVQSNTGGMVLLAIAVVVLIFIFSGGVNQLRAATSKDKCTETPGAYCKTSFSCADDYHKDFNSLCDKASTCCKPDEALNPGGVSGYTDSSCANKARGQACDDKGLMICDISHACVSRCRYCAMNGDEEVCKKNPNGNTILTNFKPSFSCQCNLTECNDRLNTSKCAKNFCPSNTPETYCCEK